MANTTKKYVSIEKLSLYDEKIKKVLADADAKVLADSKDYADGLGDNYESAGSVATAKGELQTKIDAVDAKAEAAKSANTATQGDLDTLEALVGSLPEDASADTIVGYVQEKTASIASDATVSALTGRVDAAEKAITAIEDDYLKTADKAEVTGLVATEKSRAEGVESGLRTDIDAVKADYLKAEDKTALEASIAAAKKAGDDAQADIDAFMSAADVGDAAIDTLKEIQEYITNDGAAAAAMTGNIQANANEISALKTKVGTIPTEGVSATDVVGYIQEVTTAEKTRAEGAENALDGRLDAIETKFGAGTGSVSEQISTAKTEAIEAAAADATSKDTALETKITEAYKKYADDEDAKIESRVSSLEAASATHAKASDLTAAVGRIDTAEGEIDTLQTEMDAVEAQAAANKTAIETNANNIAKKAAQTDLDNAVARIDACEAWQTNMIECSEEDINGLFAG